MSSIKKTIANQANARLSTGPRTPQGKRASASNATKHGLFAQNTPVREEDRPVFREFSQKIQADLQPQGPTEIFYVEHAIDQCWRLRLCLKIETDLFEWYRVYKEVKGGVGVAFAHDVSQLDCFSRLSRYAPLFERGLAKDLAELRKLQARHSRPSAPCPDQTAESGPDSGLRSPLGQNAPTEFAGTAAPQEPSPAATPASAAPLENPPTIGILSDQVVLADEDRSRFQAYSQSLLSEWQPRGATKAFFVELFAVTSWRLTRLSRVEAGLYEQYRFHKHVDGGVVTAFVQDASELGCFGKLANYETQVRNSLSRTLKELLA